MGYGHAHGPRVPDIEEQRLLRSPQDSSGNGQSVSYGAAAPRDRKTIHCDPHGEPRLDEDPVRLEARRRLVMACVICMLFMIVEVIGGYLSGSLAILTDAAHLLSDLAGFLISLFALWLAGFPPSQHMSFGYERAEILGATLSVFLIWMLTGVLVWEAVQRFITPEPLNGQIMFITASLGLVANIVMAGTLGIHGHSHGTGGGGGHGHSHGDASRDGVTDNINIRAAYIHVLGDMVQSAGVMIASALIWYNPSWHRLDPVCTIIFAIIVLMTTFGLLKEALHVLMEGTPRGIDPDGLQHDLECIPGVLLAHDIHIWSISIAQPAIALHLTVEPENAADRDRILLAAQDVCLAHGIQHITIQLERNDGSYCHVAQDDVAIQIQRRSTVTSPRPPQSPSPIPETVHEQHA